MKKIILSMEAGLLD